ncbi:MAG: hypothetical protein QXV32_02105 [Conexivisphaerales archaeon]
MDMFSTSIDGVSVYVEIIWSDSRTHFLSDLNMVLESDADIKLVVGSPDVLKNDSYLRDFSKAVISQRRLGCLVHGEMIDGKRILDDERYVDSELKEVVLSLVQAVKRTPLRLRADISMLKRLTSEKVSPDQVQEQLLSNLFPVTSLPEKIFSADTPFRHPLDVIAEVGEESYKIPFILKEGKIYSFNDVGNESSQFANVIDGTVSALDSLTWLETQDKRSWLISLLNQAMLKYCRNEMRLFVYKKEKRFFFPPKGTRDNVVRWNPGKRTFDRTVAKAVLRTDGSVNFWYHHAARLQFVFVGDSICLKVEPGFVFTQNGRTPVLSRRIGPLTTKWMKREYNAAYLNHVRFWMSYLSRHSDKVLLPCGRNPIAVSTNPLDTKMEAGIGDDVRNIEQMFEMLPEQFGALESE